MLRNISSLRNMNLINRVTTWKLKQNGHHFSKRYPQMHRIWWIYFKISLVCVRLGTVNNKPALLNPTGQKERARTHFVFNFNFCPFAFQAEGVLSMPASVHLSVCPSLRQPVCPSARKLYLVRHKFELESPNLHQSCIMEYSRLVLKMQVFDPHLQRRFGHFDLQF